MDIIDAYAALNRDPSASRLVAYLLSSIPSSPVNGESLAAALADCEPADFQSDAPRPLPTQERAVVVSGSAVFRSSRADGRTVAAVGLALYQSAEPQGFIGYALFDSTFSFVAGEQELAADVLCVGGLSS